MIVSLHFVFVVIFAFNFSATCQNTKFLKNDSATQKQLKRLDILADSILYGNKSKRATYEQAFFKLFPSSYTDFTNLYGYEDSRGGEITYSIGYFSASKHVDSVFRNLNSISRPAFYKKILSIAYKSSYQSDALEYLQDIAEREMDKNTVLFAKTLNQQKENLIISFVNFISASPIEGKGEFDHYCKFIDKIAPKLKSYPRVYKLLKKPCLGRNP